MSTLKKTLIVLALILAPVLAIQVQAENKEAFSKSQQAAIEDVVRNLLLKKEPDLIVKAAQEMQQRVEKESANKATEGLSQNRDKIFKDPTSPVGGNPKGNVTMVEFFDYLCGYCKMAAPTIAKLIGDDSNVRIVYKELPILGPVSTYASKAALASVAQGKYEAFHNALMNKKSRLTEDEVMDTAKEVGLDTDKLKKEMNSPKIEQIIEANIALAGEVGARGTPTFVIGNKVYPGAMQLEQMKEALAAARSDSLANK